MSSTMKKSKVVKRIEDDDDVTMLDEEEEIVDDEEDEEEILPAKIKRKSVVGQKRRSQRVIVDSSDDGVDDAATTSSSSGGRGSTTVDDVDMSKWENCCDDDDGDDEFDNTVSFPTVKEVTDEQFRSMENLPEGIVFHIRKVTMYKAKYKDKEATKARIVAFDKEGKKYLIVAAPTFTKTLINDERYFDKKSKWDFYFTYSGKKKSNSGYMYNNAPITIRSKVQKK